MGYSEAAWERAMKIQEVILRALSGEIHWFQAAEILGLSTRTMRRYRIGLEKWGYDGLFDHRRRSPSPRSVPVSEVKRILGLYRERYRGWNVRHFYQTACREHGVRVSYAFVKEALQGAGLVLKCKARGRHRRRRERRACFGEMLHIDGSKHAWLALCPEERPTLITVVDDATSRLLYAQIWPAESTRAVLTAIREVVDSYGIPASLYTDRASWAFETPAAGASVSKTHLTQVGQVLKRLGVEHIPSYSPQARGRSERMNGTLQGRLVNELELAGARSLEAANRFIRDRYLVTHNEAFSVQPREAESAFVSPEDAPLDEIFCRETVRQVGKDNAIDCGKVVLQISKQPGRKTCAGLAVTVKEYLDGRWSIYRGAQLFGRYDAQGRPRGQSAEETTHQDGPGTTISRRDGLRVKARFNTYGQPRSRRPVEAAGPVEAGPRSSPSKRLPQGPWTPANGRRRPQLPQAPSPANG
jgi:transposase